MHFKERTNEQSVYFCDYMIFIEINLILMCLRYPQFCLPIGIILHVILFLPGAYKCHPIRHWAKIFQQLKPQIAPGFTSNECFYYLNSFYHGKYPLLSWLLRMSAIHAVMYHLTLLFHFSQDQLDFCFPSYLSSKNVFKQNP